MPIALGRMISLQVKQTLAVFTEFTVLSILYVILMKAFLWIPAIAPSRKQKVSINKDSKNKFLSLSTPSGNVELNNTFPFKIKKLFFCPFVCWKKKIKTQLVDNFLISTFHLLLRTLHLQNLLVLYTMTVRFRVPNK